jgi:hypothetical protein
MVERALPRAFKRAPERPLHPVSWELVTVFMKWSTKIRDLRFSDCKMTARILLCVLGALGGSYKCQFDRILNFVATKWT